MRDILNAINQEIIRLAGRICSESRYPGSDVDRSDEMLTDCKNRLEMLRRIRTEIEDGYMYDSHPDGN